MRPVVISALAVALSLSLAAATNPSTPSVVTVILDFKGPHSPASVKEMKRETASILKSSGLQLDWRILGEDPYGTYSELVVMTFKGTCEFEPAPPRYDELGPLAITRMTNGEVQPFGEVDCDRVISSAASAMSGSDYARGDLLVGRALGRVVAHEMVHMLTRSGTHASEGVQRAALSGRQLIAGVLPLDPLDIERLRQERLNH